MKGDPMRPIPVTLRSALRCFIGLQTAATFVLLAAGFARPVLAEEPGALFRLSAPSRPSLAAPFASLLPVHLEDAAVTRLFESRGGVVRIPLPEAHTIDVELQPMPLLAPNARIMATGDGGPEPVGIEFRAYRGVDADDPATRVVVTFVGRRANVLIERGGERFTILPRAGGYLLAPAAALQESSEPRCSTPDGVVAALPGTAQRLGALAVQSASHRYYCELAIDCDYEFFASVHGGDPEAAAQYALSLVAVTSPIFERDVNVELRVVYLHLWTTPNDPYDGDSQSLFDQIQGTFNQYHPGVSRSLAHLLSGRFVGGFAWTSGTFCSGFGYGVSGVVGGFDPNDLSLVPHELGHNFGAEHTHSCYWHTAGFSPGPLDSCVVDPCSPGPYAQPLNGGTIMSYCRSIRLDFHQHPRTVMRASVENSCLIFQTDAVEPPTGLRATSLGSSVRLTWTPSLTPGVTGYEIYRSNTSLDVNPALVGTTPNIWWTDPLAPGTAYYKVKTIQGTARSSFSGETQAGVCGLEAPALHPAGNAPSDLTVADFDEDGILDVAFTDYASARIGVMRGTGLGASSRAGFTAPVYYPTNLQPVSIAHADFDEDGILDLAVVQEGSGRLSILLGQGAAGTGNGLFGPRTDFNIGAAPRDIEIADFNADGILDIATVQQLGDRVAILDGRGTAGVGDGTFAAPRTFYVADDPNGLATGDFNRDGILDLAVAKESGLRVLRGTGTGGVGDGSFGFLFQSQAGVLPNCSDVLVADFNGDLFLDLAVLKNTSSSIVIMQGNGAGTFAQTASYPVGHAPGHAIQMDANTDGLLDLVTSNGGSFTATVLLGRPGGTFAPGWLLECGDAPGGLASGDFDGDGYEDLVVACQGSDHLALYPAGCPDVATPVLTSALSAEVLDGRVRVVWSVAGGGEFEIVRSEDGTGWTGIATAFPDGSGRIVFEDVTIQPGGRYGYALRPRDVPGAAPIAAVWVDVPAWRLALSVTPNPSRGAPLRVELTLPTTAAARLELLDVGGRRIDALDLPPLGAGRHVFALAAHRVLPPGRYLVRLAFQGKIRTAAAVILR